MATNADYLVVTIHVFFSGTLGYLEVLPLTQQPRDFAKKLLLFGLTTLAPPRVLLSPSVFDFLSSTNASAAARYNYLAVTSAEARRNPRPSTGRRLCGLRSSALCGFTVQNTVRACAAHWGSRTCCCCHVTSPPPRPLLLQPSSSPRTACDSAWHTLWRAPGMRRAARAATRQAVKGSPSLSRDLAVASPHTQSTRSPAARSSHATWTTGTPPTTTLFPTAATAAAARAAPARACRCCFSTRCGHSPPQPLSRSRLAAPRRSGAPPGRDTRRCRARVNGCPERDSFAFSASETPPSPFGGWRRR